MLNMCRSLAESSQACPKMWDVPKLIAKCNKGNDGKPADFGVPGRVPCFRTNPWVSTLLQPGLRHPLAILLKHRPMPHHPSTRLDKCCYATDTDRSSTPNPSLLTAAKTISRLLRISFPGAWNERSVDPQELLRTLGAPWPNCWDTEFVFSSVYIII